VKPHLGSRHVRPLALEGFHHLVFAFGIDNVNIYGVLLLEAMGSVDSLNKVLEEIINPQKDI
jgi:hypothetical protein